MTDQVGAAEALRQAATALEHAAHATARPDKPLTTEELLSMLDEVTDSHQALATVQQRLDDLGGVLTVRALKKGVDPATLTNRPYGERRVREIRKAIGLPPRKPGPEPRRRSATDLVNDEAANSALPD